MSLFSVVSDLKIGSVVEVSGTSIKVELSGNITELSRVYQGVVYPIGQFASVIKIHHGRTVLLAYVNMLRMRSEIDREEGRIAPLPGDDSRIIEADLFAELTWTESKRTIEFRRGVRTYPLPGQSVYLTTQSEMRKVYEGAQTSEPGEANPMVPIGYYVSADATACLADIDKMFGQHCAVLGSTGCGKSATVAAIIHSVLEHKPFSGTDQTLRPRIVIIDPHGEYAAAFREKCVVYRAYDEQVDDQGNQDPSMPLPKLRLPYWTMSADEFRELVIGTTQREATSENNIVYKALIHARLVQRGWIEKARTDWEGKPATGPEPEEPRPLKEAYKALIGSYNRDTPDPFSLEEFVNHIQYEQKMRIKNEKWQPMAETDAKPYNAVLDKLAVVRSDPRLQFMMSNYRDGDPDLGRIIQQFVGEVAGQTAADCDIRIVDISGLPNEVAGPLTASIARLLFQYKTWQSREERRIDPVLLVCEEAHRYVPDRGEAEYASAQRAIRRIAKEGRKYGIGLMLVSQRPADVERTVLSQCNSWIVMRLTNSQDQEYVARFLPDSLVGLSRVLPSLSRQEAIFVGEAASIPARVYIRTLHKRQLPNSEDISFVKGWTQQPLSLAGINKAVLRWRGESAPAKPDHASSEPHTRGETA